MGQVRIRECAPGDYPAVVEIHNVTYPERTIAVEALAKGDRQSDHKYECQRWVALRDERIVGFARYSQHIWDYHPHKFHIDVAVLPDHWRQGIGSALYDRLMAGLQPYKPQKLRADGYGNLPEGVCFLQHRGFKDVFRETPLHLEVMAFDPAPYTGLEAELRAQGIQIKTLRDLEGNPGRDRKVYDLYWLVSEDVPREGELRPMDFDEWARWTTREPLVPHEGYFVAVHGDEYVGISEFGRIRGDDSLRGGLVGVKRAFRRKGVALAMQVRAVAYAREQGYALIKTSTAVVNHAMRSLYERLGYLRQPDWIQMEKVCDEG